MNRKEWQIIASAIETLKLHGYRSEPRLLERVLESGVAKSGALQQV